MQMISSSHIWMKLANNMHAGKGSMFRWSLSEIANHALYIVDQWRQRAHVTAGKFRTTISSHCLAYLDLKRFFELVQ